MSSIPSGIGSRSSSLPTNTRPCGFLSNPVDTATEGIERMNILPQGRMSTLSSVVSPMPTTATRTIAITREESRQDALETVRQMIGSTPSSTVLPMSTNTSVTHEPCVNTSNNVNTPVNEVGPRVTGPYLDSGMTDTTAPIGMATPIAPDLIWLGHPNLQGTNLFPRDDDPTTISAGGLDPEERWKIHHPDDIPGVRRPTMDTPDNLRRLAESETLVESLQTMEYFTEFPTLEERRDFWCFPPRFGDPHYHPSQLKKHDDGRSRRRPDDERPLTFGSSSDREPRRNTLGRGGFMSPMRRIVEAVRRVPSVQDVDVVTTRENIPETSVNNQWDDGIDVTPELDTQTNSRMPSTMNYSSLERENVNVEPIIVTEHVPLLNGGPSSPQQDVVNPTPTTETTASRSTSTELVPTEIVSRLPTLLDASTNATERAPLTEPIRLMTEDPQIRCTICNTVDCMIHNPRHRYCMDCGQRLLGPHNCSNQEERLTIATPHNTMGADERQPPRTENTNPEVLLPRHCTSNIDVVEDRMPRNNPLIPREIVERQIPSSAASSEMRYPGLPTYEEAITPETERPVLTEFAPNAQNVLRCSDYSSDPDEARIHFEILSPVRPSRGRHRNINSRRERWRYPSLVYDHIYCDEVEIRPPSRRMTNPGSP